MVSGRSFDRLSSQGLQVLVNVAHALAHHTVAITLDESDRLVRARLASESSEISACRHRNRRQSHSTALPGMILSSCGGSPSTVLASARAFFLYELDWMHRQTLTGMWIGERLHWGKGYGSESVRLRTSYALGELGLERIETSSMVANVGMPRALERSGFRRIGIRSHRYSYGVRGMTSTSSNCCVMTG